MLEDTKPGRAHMETSYGHDDSYTRGVGNEHKDLVHYIAEEQANDRKAIKRRRILW